MNKSCFSVIAALFFFFLGTFLYSTKLTYFDFAPGFWEAVKHDDVIRLKDFLKKNPTLLKSKFNLDYNWIFKGINLTHLVAQLKCPNMLKYLIKKGNDVNSKDDNGWTPLYFTFIKEHAGSSFSYNAYKTYCCIKVLLKNGADINVKDNSGRTPLAVFIEKIYHKPWSGFKSDELDFVEWMIKKAKANPFLKDNKDNNLLHLAAQKDCPFLSKILIANKIEINALNANNLTPLDYVIKGSKAETQLKNFGAKRFIDFINLIYLSIHNNDIDQFKALISQYPVFFHLKTNDNLTLLHKSVLDRAYPKRSKKSCSLKVVNFKTLIYRGSMILWFLGYAIYGPFSDRL
jgi:ankyrin repeat protein